MADSISIIRSGIFRLVLSFLHLVYSGLQYFDIAWALFKRKCRRRFRTREADSQLYVSHFVSKLDKCPSHFAVITGTERINLEDFSNLVVWSLTAGISYISFYDFTGYLKDNQESYYKYLIKGRKLDSNCVIFNENMNGVKNGYKKNGYSKRIHVNMLSVEDGKPLFSKIVKNICKRALSAEICTGEITEQYIDEELHRMLGFNEPELALISGEICSTYGFLPWHIKLTEFIRIPSIEELSVYEFTSALGKYSSCNQRFGR